MKIGDLSLKDLAIVISDHLRNSGIETVLSGGACVSIYTNNKYMSYDLDFVLLSDHKQKEAKKALLELGFYQENRYFKHHDSKFFVDFVVLPLSVGREPVKEISTITKGKKSLKLLSPTDCVKDRLAAFYHWKDKQALEQAVLVCRAKKIDFKEVERWSKSEGMADRFQTFLKSLEKKVVL